MWLRLAYHLEIEECSSARDLLCNLHAGRERTVWPTGWVILLGLCILSRCAEVD